MKQILLLAAGALLAGPAVAADLWDGLPPTESPLYASTSLYAGHVELGFTIGKEDDNTVKLFDATGRLAGPLGTWLRGEVEAIGIYTTVDVSVSVTERYVFVGGEVQRAGRIVWTPDLTVAKAIQSAGGFTLYAKETAVNLVREKDAYVIDVKLAQKNPTQDPHLVPGDSLHVPRSPF